jgi:hypothetical protein
MERLFYKQGDFMTSRRSNMMTGKIFENILFLAEVFGGQNTRDIPNVPFIELARSFDLSPQTNKVRSRRRRKDWPLWK